MNNKSDKDILVYFVKNLLEKYSTSPWNNNLAKDIIFNYGFEFVGEVVNIYSKLNDDVISVRDAVEKFLKSPVIEEVLYKFNKSGWCLLPGSTLSSTFMSRQIFKDHNLDISKLRDIWYENLKDSDFYTNQIKVPYITHRIWITNETNTKEISDLLDKELLESLFSSYKILDQDFWVHYIWVNNIDLVPETITMFKKNNVIVQQISEANFTKKEIGLLDFYTQEQNYGKATDFARYLILEKFGGLHMDNDVEILSDYPTNLHQVFNLIISESDGTQFANAFIASSPHHPVLKNALLNILSYYYENFSLRPDYLKNTCFITSKFITLLETGRSLLAIAYLDAHRNNELKYLQDIALPHDMLGNSPYTKVSIFLKIDGVKLELKKIAAEVQTRSWYNIKEEVEIIGSQNSFYDLYSPILSLGQHTDNPNKFYTDPFDKDINVQEDL